MDFQSKINLPISEDKVFWDKSEPDYTKKQNLALGKKVYVSSLIEVSPESAKMSSPDDSPMLTDGKYAEKATYSDPAFHKMYVGIERRIVIDLEKMSEVSALSLSFLSELQAAVKVPSVIAIKLSENGKDWQKVAETSGKNTDEASIVKVEIELGKKYAARFVAVEFNIDCWVFCDEFEIYGCKQVSAAAEAIKPDPEKTVKYIDRYVYPEDFYDIHDILLFYNCLAKDPVRGLITKEQILPYVGYMDESGEIKDYFFDSYLFLPFVSNAPSGGFYYDNPKAPGNFSDWQYYVDNVFADGANINALDEAVGEVNAKLGQNKKLKIFFSILYPSYTQKDFGSINGGKSLDFGIEEDRQEALKWLINEQLERFKKGNYKNLELIGYYWFHESFSYSDKKETALIRFTTDYVRSIGYKTIWIPYYQASGFNYWQEVGIDVACMQPNYAFTKNPPKVVYDCANTVKKLGMCLEMEIGGLSDEAVDKFDVYLKAGVETGYMDALHMYYQGGGPGEFGTARLSDNKKVRAVYDKTYKFVKHTLTLDDFK